MARPSIPPNWIALKAEFIASDHTLAAFSRKVGIAPNTLTMRAKREGWTEARTKSRERIATRSVKAAENRAFETADDVNRRQHRVARRILEKAEEAIEKGALRPQDAKAWSEAIDKLSEQLRLSAGLPTTPKRIEVSGELELGGDGMSILKSKLDDARRKLKRLGVNAKD